MSAWDVSSDSEHEAPGAAASSVGRLRSRSPHRVVTPVRSTPSPSPDRCDSQNRFWRMNGVSPAKPLPVDGLYWQHTLHNAGLDSRQRLPEKQSHVLQWELTFAGCASEVPIAKVLTRTVTCAILHSMILLYQLAQILWFSW
jgi:hypothetical protein